MTRLDLRTRLTLWRWRLLARWRRPRVLSPEPMGFLVIGTTSFPVDSITLRNGAFYVSGRKMNPFPGGSAGAGFPRTYQLIGPDGQLVREGRLPAGEIGYSNSSMDWRMTVSIDVRHMPYDEDQAMHDLRHRLYGDTP